MLIPFWKTLFLYSTSVCRTHHCVESDNNYSLINVLLVFQILKKYWYHIIDWYFHSYSISNFTWISMTPDILYQNYTRLEVLLPANLSQIFWNLVYLSWILVETRYWTSDNLLYWKIYIVESESQTLKYNFFRLPKL